MLSSLARRAPEADDVPEDLLRDRATVHRAQPPLRRALVARRRVPREEAPEDRVGRARAALLAEHSQRQQLLPRREDVGLPAARSEDVLEELAACLPPVGRRRPVGRSCLLQNAQVIDAHPRVNISTPLEHQADIAHVSIFGGAVKNRVSTSVREAEPLRTFTLL